MAVQTVTYTGKKLTPVYPTPGGNKTAIKLATGIYKAGQILEETALRGTFRALTVAANAKLLLELDCAVDINGNIFLGSQTANEIGVGDPSTSAYNEGKFLTTDLLGIVPNASLTTALTGANNDLKFTSVVVGAGGNLTTIRYVDPAAANAPLSVSVSGQAITVNLSTDGSSVINTTAAQITAAIAANAQAAALVVAANAAANDGTGVVTALAATALTGGSDTAAALLVTDTAIIAALGRLESGTPDNGILHVI
jgi:hypothetical protein